jgi:hypothetical protein
MYITKQLYFYSLTRNRQNVLSQHNRSFIVENESEAEKEKENKLIIIRVQNNPGNPTYMGRTYRRITENDGLLEKVGTKHTIFSVFPYIVYRSTSNAILFSQITSNKFSIFVKFLHYFRFSTKSCMFTFVRPGHLQHTLNPPLYEKYCTGMYTTEELKQCVNKSVCQARLNTSQPLLPVETCTRSRTPDVGLLDVSD